MPKKITYTAKGADELKKMLSEKREELRTLRFTAAGSRTKDTNSAKKVRAEIARIMTELTVKAKAN